MEDRQYSIDSAADNTCAWLLEHNSFQEWAAQKRGLLWISGNPGAGKSTLLKYALKKTSRDEPLVKSKVLFLSFFFHARGSELQKTPLGFFRSILYQILDQAPSALSNLVEHFKKNCETKGSPVEKWNWHEAELRDFFISSLSTILTERSLRIFVDALDECGDTAARKLVEDFRILLALPSTEPNSTFTICFTCRHYPLIEFRHGAKVYVEKENNQDIATYIRERLTDDDPKTSEIRNIILQRASGIFQWARIVVERVKVLRLNGEVMKTIKEEIERIPQDLNKLYRELLENVSQEERPRVLKLIQWVLFAIRPLSLDELRFAMAIDPDSPYTSLRECHDAGIIGDGSQEMERRVQSLSRGLAETRVQHGTQIVQFIHQSVNDFLVDDGLKILIDDGWQSIDFAAGSAHHRICRSCIRYIDMEEIHQWKGERGKKSGAEEREDLDKTFSFLRYATLSWPSHAETAHTKTISQSDLLDYFHWPSNNLVRLWVGLYQILGRYSDQFSPKGTTLIHLLARYSLIEPLSAIIQLLDQANVTDGVDVDSKDGFGQTPLSWATENGHEAVVKLLLATNSVDINSKDNNGWTPLSWAAENGHEAVVKLLLATDGVDVNSKDNDGQTPLSWAAENDHEAVVKLLLARDGVDVNLKANDGQTPLSLAVGNDNEAIIKLLLATDGIDVNLKANDSQTPLSYATIFHHAAIINLLLAKGAKSESNI